MTNSELRDALEKLGMSQTSLGEFAGYTDRSIRRYAAGDEEIPKILERLIRAMIACREMELWLSKPGYADYPTPEANRVTLYQIIKRALPADNGDQTNESQDARLQPRRR